MKYCFDIDGTLCSQETGDYAKAVPYPERIAKVNQLYANGHTIVLQTARGFETKIDWRQVTERQLERWGVKYHDLFFDKTSADVYVDDRGTNADDFF